MFGQCGSERGHWHFSHPPRPFHRGDGGGRGRGRGDSDDRGRGRSDGRGGGRGGSRYSSSIPLASFASSTSTVTYSNAEESLSGDSRGRDRSDSDGGLRGGNRYSSSIPPAPFASSTLTVTYSSAVESLSSGGGVRGRGESGGGGRGRDRHYSRGTEPSVPAPFVPSTSMVAHPSSSAAESLGGKFIGKLTLERQDTKTTAHLLSSSSSESETIGMPIEKPNKGTLDERFRVRVKIHTANGNLHHYSVSITPKVHSKKVMTTVMKQIESHLSCLCIYDQNLNSYTAAALPFVSKKFDVNLIDEDRNHGSSSSSKKK